MVDRNDLGIGKLKLDLAKLRSVEVVAGIMGPKAKAKHPGAPGHTVATVAAWLEFGTKTQPARPAIQRAKDQNEQEILRSIRKAGSDLVDARITTVEEALQPLVDTMREAVIESFKTSREWAEANAPSTIAAKGHDQPLIGEHFAVQQAIDAEIRDRE